MPTFNEYFYNLPQYFNLSGTVDNLGIDANFLIFDGSGPADLTGIAAPVPDESFAIVLVENRSFANLTLKANDPGSDAKNRFYFPADEVLSPGGKVVFFTTGVGWFKFA